MKRQIILKRFSISLMQLTNFKRNTKSFKKIVSRSKFWACKNKRKKQQVTRNKTKKRENAQRVQKVDENTSENSKVQQPKIEKK